MFKQIPSSFVTWPVKLILSLIYCCQDVSEGWKMINITCDHVSIMTWSWGPSQTSLDVVLHHWSRLFTVLVYVCLVVVTNSWLPSPWADDLHRMKMFTFYHLAFFSLLQTLWTVWLDVEHLSWYENICCMRTLIERLSAVWMQPSSMRQTSSIQVLDRWTLRLHRAPPPPFPAASAALFDILASTMTHFLFVLLYMCDFLF